MQSRCSGFLIGSLFLTSILAWGQSIQGGTHGNAPGNAPVQPAPAAPQSAPQGGGDFSNLTTPDPKTAVPKDTIVIKGAWYSASDSTTPVPEGSAVTNNVFADRYLGISYPLPPDWIEKYTPPPPSDIGSYVLAQIRRSDSYKGEAKGTIQFSAQDMFFTPLPAVNARQLVSYSKNHLPTYYQLEMKPTQTTIAGQPFTFFAYWSPVA